MSASRRKELNFRSAEIALVCFTTFFFLATEISQSQTIHYEIFATQSQRNEFILYWWKPCASYSHVNAILGRCCAHHEASTIIKVASDSRSKSKANPLFLHRNPLNQLSGGWRNTCSSASLNPNWSIQVIQTQLCNCCTWAIRKGLGIIGSQRGCQPHSGKRATTSTNGVIYQILPEHLQKIISLTSILGLNHQHPRHPSATRCGQSCRIHFRCA